MGLRDYGQDWSPRDMDRAKQGSAGDSAYWEGYGPAGERKYHWQKPGHGAFDEYGYTQYMPSGGIAPYAQFQAEKIADMRRTRLRQQSALMRSQALDTLGSYRPGGLAQMTSGFYENQARALETEALNYEAPDLMWQHRSDRARRSRQATQRAARTAAIVRTVGAVAGAVTGGAGYALTGAALAAGSGALADGLSPQGQQGQPGAQQGQQPGPQGTQYQDSAQPATGGKPAEHPSVMGDQGGGAGQQPGGGPQPWGPGGPGDTGDPASGQTGPEPWGGRGEGDTGQPNAGRPGPQPWGPGGVGDTSGGGIAQEGGLGMPMGGAGSSFEVLGQEPTVGPMPLPSIAAGGRYGIDEEQLLDVALASEPDLFGSSFNEAMSTRLLKMLAFDDPGGGKYDSAGVMAFANIWDEDGFDEDD